MKILLTAIALCLLLACSAAAQDEVPPQGAPPQDKDKGSISGTVVDAISGQPLKGANIRLRGMPMSEAPATQSSSAVSDTGGRFVFEGLNTGRYFLLASHEGFANDDRDGPSFRGKLLPLAPGQHVSDVVLRLLPGGVITGHITNEAGKPLRGVAVQAMKSSYAHGRRELQDAARATSNEVGEYRFAGLAPGKYYIRAKLPNAPTAKPGVDKVYVPLFYPAATEQIKAITLELRPGEELAGIDVNLVPVHTVHIRGRVIDGHTSLPCKEAEVTLLSDQGETIFSESQTFSTNGQAAFDFPGVPPGSYVLAAQPPSNARQPATLWGRTSVEVGDANLDHADILVGPGADLSGHIRVEGKTAVDLTKLAGILEPQEPSGLAGLMPDIDNASIAPDGSFVFREVPEGNYRISFTPVPAGFYFKSAGTADILETGITVNRGHALAGLELVVSPGTGRIDGTVVNDDQPSPGATVVLVPEGKRSTVRDYYRQAVTDHSGRFALRNVVPGDYTIFAWERIEHEAYLDPDVLGRYEDGGKALHMEEDGHMTLQLDVIPDAGAGP